MMDDMGEIRALQRDKAKALAKKNYREAANTCNCLGRKYSDLGQYSEAIDEHKEELGLCEMLKDPLGQAIAHRNIGECLAMTNHFKTALTHLREYLRIAAELDNISEQQRAAATFGRTYWLHYNADTSKNQSSLEKARDLYERSLKIAETKLLRDKVGEEECARMRCRANLNLALVHEHKKDYDQVMKFYQRSFELASQYKFKEELIKSQLDWGNFCQSIGKLDKAKELLDGAVKSAKSAKDKISLGEALLSKANLLILRADFDGSRHCFKQVYHLRSNDDEQRSKAIVGCKILKKVIETLKELNSSQDDEDKCKLYDRLGDLFVEIGCFKTATDYYNKELECALKLGKSPEDLAIIYVSLGQTYLDNDQPSTALDCFYKELDCRSGILDEEVKSLLKIIDCKIKLNRPEDEIETDYSYLLTKCGNSSSLKRLVLKDYKYYLENGDHPLKESKIEEVDDQLLLIPTDFNSQGAEVEEQDSEEDENRVDNQSTVSDLTDESEDEKGEEVVAGKALRVRRPNKKSDFKVNEKGETPLHVACIAGDITRVVKLIEMGHPVNPRDNAGWLPIHEAANHGHAEVVKYLIDHGANLNDRGGDLCGGTTPLHDACVNGNLAVIRILIRNGANVVRQDEEGNTPLDCFQAYVSQQSPASEEMDDYQLLINELKEKMKESGYDFSSVKSIKGSKRSHSSRSTAFEKPLIGLRNCREIDISSPPRKIRMNENSREGGDGARAYRDEIARQRRPNAVSHSSEAQSDTRPRIRSLINENEVLNDSWLEPDIDPTLMKDRPMRDPFKGTRSSKNSGSSTHASSKSKDQPRNRSRNPKFMRDDMLGNDGVEMPNVQEDRGELDDFIVDDRDDDQDSLSADYSEPQDINIDCMFPKRKPTNQSNRHQNEYTVPQECEEIVSSTSQQSAATTCSTASSRGVNVQPLKEDKILIKVHVNGKTLLVPVQGKTHTIGWLAERIAERYARSWQLKPVLSLMNKDSAIFGAEDLITDVVPENEVYADVQSWELDPLDKRYEESCKKRSIKPYTDLVHILRLADSSGCLTLNNVRLGKLHSQALLEALKHQANLRCLDLSFTDVIINDSNFLLGEAISTMKNLSEINLKGTGFTRDRIPILTAKNLPSLSSINLSYNHLRDDSVDFLLNSVLQYSTLSTLDVRFNDFSSTIFDKSDISNTLGKSSAKVLR